MKNRFKRLDLIDRVPEEQWMEVCDTVQETGIKSITKKKKCKKAKWFSEETLQITVKRKEVKGKGYPLQYSGLENSMDSTWGCKELDMTERLSLSL